MNTNVMTETDALGESIAFAIRGASSYGKDEATKAVTYATKLFQAGKVDAATFAGVVSRLGNHSATRQHLEKHALIPVAKDGLATAIESADMRFAEAEEKQQEAAMKLGDKPEEKKK